MRHYCTLFDSKYLAQGLVLYESLRKYSSEPFGLHVLVLDDQAVESIESIFPWGLVDGNLVVYHLAHFEEVATLSEVRSNRTWQEYCWTLASQFTEFLMNRLRVDVTYLDADLMFFSDPEVIHDEIGERSIAVIPHRLIPSKKHLEVNGQFNVSWVTFKNNPVGRECCSTWAWQCRDRCSATIGCGDQVYLDAWPAKYGPELCIIQNIGAGLAPWNLANYGLYQFNGPPQVAADRGSGFDGFVPVVFYHYHEFKSNGDGTFRLTNYDLRPEDVGIIYEPYVAAIGRANSLRRGALSGVSHG